MAANATRVRRLRIRRAARWSTLLLGVVALAASIAPFRTSARERPVPIASPSERKLSDVGVWVAQGRVAAQLESGPLAEVLASATSVGTSPAVAVRAVVMGKVHDVLTNAATAGELLSAMGITPDADDRVLPPPSTPLHSGGVVRFDRVRVFLRQVRERIPARAFAAFVDSLRPGKEVAHPGAPGLVLDTYRVRSVDGRVASRKLIDRRVARGAVDRGRRRVGAPPTTSSISSNQRVGEASWYEAPGAGFTAASPSLAFGTHVVVTNLITGESVVVVIDDRGPFGGRVIDLSPEAFSALSYLGRGVIPVRLSW